MKANNRLIGENQPIFIVAEVGINHNGEIDIAKQLIKAAKDSGADAAKFQTYSTEKRVPKNSPVFDLLKKCEFNLDETKSLMDYAKENEALILFDAAYEAFITEKDIPHSIYEIEGADEVAIEFRSFSKTAGFTGTRCAYTVVPKNLMGKDGSGKEVSLNALWNRRVCTKFNGVSYIVQRGAEACYSEMGKKELKETIDYYMENAKIVKDGLTDLGIECYGGVNSPYIWLKTPGGLSSWEFFDKLLEEAGVAGTPGAGFGKAGEGYFRLTAFNTLENTLEAVNRISKMSL